MRLDLSDLKLVTSIADAGSITGGARYANLAVGSASERLKSIEEDIGAKLFCRHPRGISLTESGEILVRHARDILAQHARLKTELNAYVKGMKGSIRLYANTSAMNAFLPVRLATWLTEHPEVTIQLEEKSSPDIVNAIDAGLIEAGLVSDAVDAGELTLEPIADDPLALILPDTHPLASCDRITLSQAAGEPFIGMYPGNVLQDHISNHARASGQTLTYRIRMSSFEGVCEMVNRGIGAGIIPVTVAERISQKLAFRTVPLDDPWARRKICLCYKSLDSLSPLMARLLDFLRYPGL